MSRIYQQVRYVYWKKIAIFSLLIILGATSCIPTDGNNGLVFLENIDFPVSLIAELTPIPYTKDNAQFVYCYFDHELTDLEQVWELGVVSLDHSVRTKLAGPYEQIDQHNLGCLEGGIYGLDWSLDGKFLLFNDHNNLLVLSEIATNGEQLSIVPLLNPPQYTFYNFAHAPAWSSDGNKVAFISQFQDEASLEPGSPYIAPSVFVIETDSPDAQPEPLQLYNFLPGVVSNLVWSHDGNYLAYVLPVPDNGIGVIHLDSGVLTTLNPDTVPDIPPGTKEMHGILPQDSIAWLPGDNLILFLTNGEDATEDILWVAERDGTNPIKLYEGSIEQIELSPDGQILALIVSQSGHQMIQIMRLEETVQVQTILDTAEWESNAMVRDLDWSPDSQKLLFAANPVDKYDLYLIEMSTFELVQITNTPNVDEIAPHWRPYLDVSNP